MVLSYFNLTKANDIPMISKVTINKKALR